MKKKEDKDKSQTDLFEEKKNEKLFESIKVDEVKFPIFFKNKNETIYTCYFDYEKFEQLDMRKTSEPYLSSILWGYSEIMRQLKGNIEIFLYTLYREKIEIQAEEYEEAFNKALNERKNFFTTTEYKYVERELSERQKNIHHKWKPIDL